MSKKSMSLQEFGELIRAAKKAWRRAAVSNSGLVVDPAAHYERQAASEFSQQIRDAYATALEQIP